MIEIRCCKIEETDKLQKYINDYWKSNHILNTNKELLYQQHYNKVENILNFIVANDTEIDIFIAILGYIPIWQFDQNLKTEKDIWLSLWKSIETNNAFSGLGLR